jgi:predicted nucleotidyltransferase component of viral defense system
MNGEGLTASVRQRLANLSRESGEAFDYVLGRYGVERLLYRLGASEWADRFVLKGAMLFHVWNRKMHRPTRDLDLLGFGPDDAVSLRKALEGVLAADVPDDGLLFDADSLRIDEIREGAEYGGLRAKVLARLGKTRIPVQIDVGFGDVVVPAPETREFPALLGDFPPPVLRTYPAVSVVAKKFEALVSLDEHNSRMKDFYDLRLLLSDEGMDRDLLMEAIRATFRRRGTQLPEQVPAGLSDAFAAAKEPMWRAFLNRSGLDGDSAGFAEVVGEIRSELRRVWETGEESI